MLQAIQEMVRVAVAMDKIRVIQAIQEVVGKMVVSKAYLSSFTFPQPRERAGKSEMSWLGLIVMGKISTI